MDFIETISDTLSNVDVVLDIGSRFGEDAQRLKTLFPTARIYAFEPTPSSIATWKTDPANIGITLIEKAVNDFTGMTTFYVNNPEKTKTSIANGNQGANSLYKASSEYPYETYVQDEITVSCITLKDWAKENGIDKIDVIWMDVQGAELNVLKGMGELLRTVRAIHTEVEFNPMYLEQPLYADIDAFLRSFGFKFECFENLFKEWFADANYTKEIFSMKDVCVLGCNGFIGSNVLEILRQTYNVNGSEKYDVLVNCAGFSKMYEGNRNPEKMQTVEDLVFDRINHVQFDRLIHLSTIYIEIYPQDIYSRIKLDMENRILSRYDNTTILRLGGVIGKGLKKNIVFDLLHDNPLFVAADSIYNYISAEEIACIIVRLIEQPISGIINVGAAKSIYASYIAALMCKTPIYGPKYEVIHMDVSMLQSFYSVKTSEDYIEEFLRGQPV